MTKEMNIENQDTKTLEFTRDILVDIDYNIPQLARTLVDIERELMYRYEKMPTNDR